MHRTPENYHTPTQTMADFARSAALLAAKATAAGITLHLRVGEDDKPPHTLAEAAAFLTAAGKPANLKLAVCTGPLAKANISDVELGTLVASGTVGAWLVATAVDDPFTAGISLTVHGALASASQGDAQATRRILRAGRDGSPAGAGTGAPFIVLDSSMPGTTDEAGQTEEFSELSALRALL